MIIYDWLYFGEYYKIGRFGFLYVWRDDEWKKSTANVDDVKSGTFAAQTNYIKNGTSEYNRWSFSDE